MAAQKFKLSHPGKILREEFMEPIGLTAYALAKAKVAKQASRISPHPHGMDGSLQPVSGRAGLPTERPRRRLDFHRTQGLR